MSKRIGILGGTFDPVHKGHVTIAKAFLDSGFIDELWVMPAPDPPHKREQDVTSFDIRQKLLKIAFEGIHHIYISSFEKDLDKPSYTLRTIRALKKQYPDDQFILCLGSDSILHIDSWFHADELIKETIFLVAYRPGFNPEELPERIRNKCHFVEHSPINVSSTELKKKLKAHRPTPMIPKAVSEEINKLSLYQ